MKKNYYTKKEIKTIKKEIAENGIYAHGFYWGIKKEITFDEIMEALENLKNDGIDISQINCDIDTFIVLEVLRQSKYQDFKNRFFEYII